MLSFCSCGYFAKEIFKIMLIHASMIRKFMQISSALNSYKKNRAYNFTPLGRIHIRGTTQIPYVKNENYFYIHDKTLNSRNE